MNIRQTDALYNLARIIEVGEGKGGETYYTVKAVTGRKPGGKEYELKDHLGNVRVVISDMKHSVISPAGVVGSFNADVKVMRDYYAFGMEMPEQVWQAGGYRYGFNGMERDDELKGQGASYDFGARMYDPRVGRWFSTDPFERKFPQWSTYSFCFNAPMDFVDHDGKEPDRKRAGTVAQAVCEWQGLKDQSIDGILNFLRDSKVSVRYIYTEKSGWIDLQHYFGVLKYGYHAMGVLEDMSGQATYQNYLGPGADASFYSYEDLPSNYFASQFVSYSQDQICENSIEIDDLGKTRFISGTKKELKQGQLLISDVAKHLESAKPLEPQFAPNWCQIPFEDHDRKRLPVCPTMHCDNRRFLPSGDYVPQNHTTKPYDLRNFPAAPTSLDRGNNSPEPERCK